MPKKKTKRSRDKYRNLKPELNLKTRYEEIADVASYANTLSPKDKAWLDKFMKEYVGASLDSNPKKRIDPSDEWKKTCYDRNNARNRDVITIQKAQGAMNYLEELPVVEREMSSEDLLIQRMDLEQRIKEKNSKSKKRRES